MGVAPPPTSIVVVTVPELGELRARVMSALEDQIVLTPLQRPTTPLLLLSYDATLRRAVAGDDEEGVVGTLIRQGEKWLFEPSRDQRLQERQAVRVAAPVLVGTSPGAVPAGETVDLSATGALIRLPTPPRVGSAMELELHLPDGRPALRVGASVVRAVGDGNLVGVRFEAFDGAGERRLARFLFTQQWAASRPSAAAKGPPGSRSRATA